MCPKTITAPLQPCQQGASLQPTLQASICWTWRLPAVRLHLQGLHAAQHVLQKQSYRELIRLTGAPHASGRKVQGPAAKLCVRYAASCDAQ